MTVVFGQQQLQRSPADAVDDDDDDDEHALEEFVFWLLATILDGHKCASPCISFTFD